MMIYGMKSPCNYGVTETIYELWHLYLVDVQMLILLPAGCKTCETYHSAAYCKVVSFISVHSRWLPWIFMECVSIRTGKAAVKHSDVPT
jgi:hypothetical protein